MKRVILLAACALLVTKFVHAQFDNIDDYEDTWLDSRLSHFADTIYYGEVIGQLDSVIYAENYDGEGWESDPTLVFSNNGSTEAMRSSFTDEFGGSGSIDYKFGLPPIDSFWIETFEQYPNSVGTMDTFSSVRRGLRHRNSTGKIDSITSEALSIGPSASGTDFETIKFDYESDQLVQVSSTVSGTANPEQSGEILTFEYDGSGKVSEQMQSFWFETDTILENTISFTYLSENETLYTFGEDSDISTIRQYQNIDGTLDSIRAFGEDGGMQLGAAILRTDDGNDARFREYSILADDQDPARTQFYFAQNVSSARERPLITGRLVGANPTYPGAFIQLNDLPPISTVSILDIHGRPLYSAPSSVQSSGTFVKTSNLNIQWPLQKPGMYYITVQAPGYETRAWPIIAQ